MSCAEEQDLIKQGHDFTLWFLCDQLFSEARCECKSQIARISFQALHQYANFGVDHRNFFNDLFFQSNTLFAGKALTVLNSLCLA